MLRRSFVIRSPASTATNAAASSAAAAAAAATTVGATRSPIGGGESIKSINNNTTTIKSPDTKQPQSDLVRERTQQMLNMRKSPYGIGNKQTLHSHLLSDHAMTVKASREEAAYRLRALEERGVFDAQAREEAQKIKEEQARTPECERHAEIRWVYLVALVGYLLGHISAHNLFEVDDMRLPYDPVNGFVNDLALQKQMLSKIDDHVHTHVVGRILQTKEAKRQNVLHASLN